MYLTKKVSKELSDISINKKKLIVAIYEKM